MCNERSAVFSVIRGQRSADPATVLANVASQKSKVSLRFSDSKEVLLVGDGPALGSVEDCKSWAHLYWPCYPMNPERLSYILRRPTMLSNFK